MMRLFLGLVFLTSPLVAQSAVMPLPRPFDAIVFVDSVIDQLAVLADTSSRETARCLIGRSEPPNIIIYFAVTPLIYRRDSLRVESAPCPVETVAFWHLHTPYPGIPNAGRCFLSRADIEMALSQASPALQIVAVREGLMCWWSKGQIYEANRRMILQPIGTQVFKRQ